MKIIFFMTLLFAGCSQTKLKINGTEESSVKVIPHLKYEEVKGAEDALRNTKGATLMVTLRAKERKKEPQDILSFSVGGPVKTDASRASLRLEDGHLVGIARSLDRERGSAIMSKEKIPFDQLHTAALVVDYPNDNMKLYLNGKKLNAVGRVNFGADSTADTSSNFVAIGAEDNGLRFFFNGEIKNPKVWSRTLSPEEIQQYSTP